MVAGISWLAGIASTATTGGALRIVTLQLAKDCLLGPRGGSRTILEPRNFILIIRVYPPMIRVIGVIRIIRVVRPVLDL